MYNSYIANDIQFFLLTGFVKYKWTFVIKNSAFYLRATFMEHYLFILDARIST